MTNTLMIDAPYIQFDKIKPEDFIEAFNAEIAAANTALSTFLSSDYADIDWQDGLKFFDKMFLNLNRVTAVLGHYSWAIGSDEIAEIEEKIDSDYSGFSKYFFQNRDLAARFKSIAELAKVNSNDPQDFWFIERLEREFLSEGAFLDAEGQKKLQEIDVRLIELSSKFKKNLKEGRETLHSFLITNEAELAGLPVNTIDGMKEAAIQADKLDGWLFIPERLKVDNLLACAENRDFREKMYKSMLNLGSSEPFNNEPVIAEMHNLRQLRAILLGFTNHAEYNISKGMAKTTYNALELLNNASEALTDAFENDYAVLQKWVSSFDNVVMEPWDLEYYTSRYKREVLGFDAKEFSEYLGLDNVLSGWINHVQKCMNISLERQFNIPVWNDDIIVLKVLDKDTNKSSFLFLDLFERSDEKIGGAWMHQLQATSELSQAENCVIFCMNLAKPSVNQPTLLTKDQVETFYHEGGHALNGLLGTETKYFSHRGVSGTSDFFEIHSMIQESWAFKPEVLNTYAAHHKSGVIIPQTLVESFTKASDFMSAKTWIRGLQNALWDIGFHTVSPKDYKDTKHIEKQFMIKGDYTLHTRPYSIARFDHMFFDGMSEYAAGYYGYFWSEVSQATAFQQFEEKGLYDPQLLRKLKGFYSMAGALNPREIYSNLASCESGNPTALLLNMGITVSQKSLKP